IARGEFGRNLRVYQRDVGRDSGCNRDREFVVILRPRHNRKGSVDGGMFGAKLLHELDHARSVGAGERPPKFQLDWLGRSCGEGEDERDDSNEHEPLEGFQHAISTSLVAYLYMRACSM